MTEPDIDPDEIDACARKIHHAIVGMSRNRNEALLITAMVLTSFTGAGVLPTAREAQLQRVVEFVREHWATPASEPALYRVEYPSGRSFSVEGELFIDVVGGLDTPVIIEPGGRAVVLDPRAVVHDAKHELMFQGCSTEDLEQSLTARGLDWKTQQ